MLEKPRFITKLSGGYIPYPENLFQSIKKPNLKSVFLCYLKDTNTIYLIDPKDVTKHDCILAELEIVMKGKTRKFSFPKELHQILDSGWTNSFMYSLEGNKIFLVKWHNEKTKV